jgi:hypothetical protein
LQSEHRNRQAQVSTSTGIDGEASGQICGVCAACTHPTNLCTRLNNSHPPKIEREIELPEELIEALESNPELGHAFELLTPGRQHSYVFALNSAKTSATKVARIIKYRDKIIAGKGALDR